MNCSELEHESWDQLQFDGNASDGYFGLFIKGNDVLDERILIFKDEESKLHFVIDAGGITSAEAPNPKIHGLSVSVKRYRFKDIGVRSYFDLECSDQGYRRQFTAFVKEIGEKVLISGKEPLAAINEVLSVWRSFWSGDRTSSLSEEEQVGLICELRILRKVCEADLELGLTYWRGPKKEKQDFLFGSLAMEVKGSRNGHHRHVVNGLDQLRIPQGKQLALASFLVSRTDHKGAKSLAEVIRGVSEDFFKGRPDLLREFHLLLNQAGYTPLHDEEYLKIKFEIHDGRIYLVNQNFPRLTTEHLRNPLDQRISEIRYSIDLGDVAFTSVENFSFLDSLGRTLNG